MTIKSRIAFILRVSSRYLLSKRSGSSRLINLVSFLGLVLGLTLLIVVLSVLNGTRDLIDKDFFSVYPHAVARISSDQVELLDELNSLAGVISVEPFVDLYVLLNSNRNVTLTDPGISLYAFDTNSSNRIFRQMHSVMKEERDLPLAGLDVRTANDYGLTIGDTFTITAPLATTQGVRSKTVAFRFAHPLWLGERWVISKIMFANISDLIATGLISTDQVHHRITLDEPSHASLTLDEYPEVVTWTERWGSFFQALAREKMILFILLLFVIGLVTMNVISGQAMLINRKSSDIAILQTMGAELRWISIIFIVQSAIIVLAGIVVGTILGCVVSRYAHNIMIFATSGRSLGLQFDSAVVSPSDLVWTTLGALAVGLLAVLRPLNLVYRKEPVDSLNRMV